MNRQMGWVKIWTKDKHFGWLTPLKDGQDIFLHENDWSLDSSGGELPRKGMTVDYDLQFNEQTMKYKAINCVLSQQQRPFPVERDMVFRQGGTRPGPTTPGGTPTQLPVSTCTVFTCSQCAGTLFMIPWPSMMVSCGMCGSQNFALGSMPGPLPGQGGAGVVEQPNGGMMDGGSMWMGNNNMFPPFNDRTGTKRKKHHHDKKKKKRSKHRDRDRERGRDDRRDTINDQPDDVSADGSTGSSQDSSSSSSSSDDETK